MALSLRLSKGWPSRLKAFPSFPRLNHMLAEGELQAQGRAETSSDAVPHLGDVDRSKWKTHKASQLGTSPSSIPESSWTVLKLLHNAGFDAYLVGGCIRDLLLNKIPKDFDVITTAELKEVKRKFHKAIIVGRRFPVCRVTIKGSVIEVTSFKTVALGHCDDEKVNLYQKPTGCNERELLLWRNSMQRDFTINSLFLDPFKRRIYDYTNALADLRSLRLRTIVPARLSFKEDCARILRGLRIAARLGLALSKDVENAIDSFSSSITCLNKDRLMLELNYMLSYGAAEPSLSLLRRFKLLQILLPFHAAYLDEQDGGQSNHNSSMLMKLFFNLDKLVSCDQPSDCTLWIALLAFHLALVKNPQDPLVILTFASVLYHGGWKEGFQLARESAKLQVSFTPEVSVSSGYRLSELAEGVSHFASLVQESVAILSDEGSLIESMSQYPQYPCSGLVLVSKKSAEIVSEIFQVLVDDVKSYNHERKCFQVNYGLLSRGFISETRYVIGKIILETMTGGVIQIEEEAVEKGKNHAHMVRIQQETVNHEWNHGSARRNLTVLEESKNDKKRSHLELSPRLLKEGADERRKFYGKNHSLLVQKAKKRKVAVTKEFNETVKECQERVKTFESCRGGEDVMKGKTLGISPLLSDLFK